MKFFVSEFAQFNDVLQKGVWIVAILRIAENRQSMIVLL